MKLYRKIDGGHRPVTINGVQPECVLGIMLAVTVYADLGLYDGLTLTDVMRPADQARPGSFHVVGLAFDCRIWEAREKGLLDELVSALKKTLGAEWDVVLKETHIHCELDVRD